MSQTSKRSSEESECTYCRRCSRARAVQAEQLYKQHHNRKSKGYKSSCKCKSFANCSDTGSETCTADSFPSSGVCGGATMKALPFFPEYGSQLTCDEHLRVTWFEPDFSQCRYNFDNTTCSSNACTLIVLLAAYKCSREKIHLTGPGKSVNYYLIKALAESMLEGNQVHDDLKRKGALPHINLTVPEAITFAGNRVNGIKEWKSMLYMECLSSTLYENLKKQWNEWQKTSLFKQHPDLYVVLICSSRSVLFIINPNKNTVTLIDSHQHTCSKGALIAVADRQKTKYLCSFFCQVMSEYYKSSSNLYELSMLYFRRRCCSCAY